MRSRVVPLTRILPAFLVAATAVGVAWAAESSTPSPHLVLEANDKSLAIDPPPEAGSPEHQAGIAGSSDHVPIHYSTYGTGSPALVFVHGISCDQSYWRKQVGPFSRDLQVVTVDLAGHGESGTGRKDWSMEAYGGDVAAVVGDLELQNVILVGHSMGGAVILETARLLPGRVDGIVIVDTFESFDTWWTPDEIEEVLAPLRKDFVEQTRAWVRGMFTEESDPAFIEEIMTDMSSAPPEIALASLKSAITKMYGRERTTALKDLGAPVFIINADYSPSDVESLERHGAEVHIIPGTEHFFMMEEAAAFNSVLSGVVRRLLEAPNPFPSQ